MPDLQLVIPSRSRPYVKTLMNISMNLWPIVTIVVPEDQYSDYRVTVPSKVEVIPFGTKGICQKRQFILNMKPTGKVIMFDDDLTLYRRSDDGLKFAPMYPPETEILILEMVRFLDNYPMVGVTDKFMSHTKPRRFMECTRFNQILGFNRDLLPNPWPEFRIPHDEEHDIHLQLLTRGHKTAVLTEYTKTDKKGPGGCSDWRSQEVYDETYRLLLEYWPSIVTVVNNRANYRWKEAMRIGGLT